MPPLESIKRVADSIAVEVGRFPFEHVAVAVVDFGLRMLLAAATAAPMALRSL